MEAENTSESTSPSKIRSIPKSKDSFSDVNKSRTDCSILTVDPAKHAIPKTVEVHILLAWASLADNMRKG